MKIVKQNKPIRKLIDLKPNTVKKLRLIVAKKETNVKTYIQELIENHVNGN